MEDLFFFSVAKVEWINDASPFFGEEAPALE